eukprot:scaffold14011_cov122-Isochrysis_galbana.AAC.4
MFREPGLGDNERQCMLGRRPHFVEDALQRAEAFRIPCAAELYVGADDERLGRHVKTDVRVACNQPQKPRQNANLWRVDEHHPSWFASMMTGKNRNPMGNDCAERRTDEVEGFLASIGDDLLSNFPVRRNALVPALEPLLIPDDAVSNDQRWGRRVLAPSRSA